MLLAGVLIWGMFGMRARVAALVQDRLGLATEIEDTALSVGGMELFGVQMQAPGGGLSVRIDRVEARMSLIAALFEGSRAVRRLSAEGVDVVLDLRHEGLTESIDQLISKVRGRDGTSDTRRPATAPGRIYDVDRLNVRVLDSHGTLLALRNASVQKESDTVSSRIEDLVLGSVEGDHAHCERTTIELERSEEGWKLRELDVEHAAARAVRSEDDPSGALVRRIEDARSAFSSGSPRTAETSERPEKSGEVEPVPEPRRRLFARLASDAQISISDVQIESRISASRVEQLRDFTFELRGDDQGWYRIATEGKTTRGGTMRIDLDVMPTEARAEGSIALRSISLALMAPFIPDLPIHDADEGTLSAELGLVAEAGERVRIDGALTLHELGLASEKLAPEPVDHIGLAIDGKGVWYPKERRLAIQRGQIRMGRARVLIEGEVERTPEHYRADLVAKVPPADCNDVVSAVPDDILAPLAGFRWSGTWSAIGRLSLDSRDLDATELTMRVRNLCQFERAPRWARVERFQQPFVHRVVEPDESTFEMRTGPGTETWVSSAELSPFVVPAIISHEDGGFYEHGGFAPWAIRDALVRNLQEGRYVVGASTISMQLAKNLFLEREKTLARKVQEVFLTWWLENALDKEQILELYVNVIEYGPGVYGLRHAASYYFGREPYELSPAEAAFLACMLPSPKRYHVSYERGELTRSMKSRVRRLLEHMQRRERIGAEALEYGLAELEGFRFHRADDPPPPPRVLPPLGAPEDPTGQELDPFEALFVSP